MKKQSKIAPGMVNVTTTLPREIDAELKRLAKESGVTRNVYVRTILEDVAKKQVVLVPQGFKLQSLEGNKDVNQDRTHEPFNPNESSEETAQ